FSASKIRWLLHHRPDGQRRAQSGDPLFGTLDSRLVWNLTDHHDHATDWTNAARPVLVNIHTGDWHADRARTLQIQRRSLPAVEGAVFTAGAALQWLRDSLGLIAAAADSEAMALSVPDTDGVMFVPAFAGLGSPYWDPAARGTMLGLTAGTRREHIVRATLEA